MTVRILIVDDELALLSAISEYLTDRGFVCECASEAAEALALLAHIAFDVVVTDVYLSSFPRADGFAVVSFIRERVLPSRVIVMTAHDTEQIIGESERLGADLFLSKPVRLNHLAEVLGTFAGSAP
jgi:CheY-like chemotaxis protein